MFKKNRTVLTLLKIDKTSISVLPQFISTYKPMNSERNSDSLLITVKYLYGSATTVGTVSDSQCSRLLFCPGFSVIPITYQTMLYIQYLSALNEFQTDFPMNLEIYCGMI